MYLYVKAFYDRANASPYSYFHSEFCRIANDLFSKENLRFAVLMCVCGKAVEKARIPGERKTART